ncbi:hypothetical protein T492DRAFT_1104495 [Pavlovales sp. CCMP2436]|nr:hypothetical protein T492DRAFT_1104495 [Pavlovales sp. CCMP2436]
MPHRPSSMITVEQSISATTEPRNGERSVQTRPHSINATTKPNAPDSARMTRYGCGYTTSAPSTSAGLSAHANTPTALTSGMTASRPVGHAAVESGRGGVSRMGKGATDGRSSRECVLQRQVGAS